MSEEVIHIWNEINGRLLNFVNSKVKDSDLSKDIVQNVFLKVFSKIDTLKNKEKLVSWIYQITRNEISTHFRGIQFNSSSKEVEEVVLDKTLTLEVSECMHPLINSLPEKYKEALVLADIEKIPQKQMAEMLNISYSGAKSRVQRARQMLRATFEECCDISTDIYGDIIDYKKKDCSRNCD